MMGYYAKAIGLWLFAAAFSVNPRIGVISQADPITQILGGGLTVLGMAFLIWRLVADHSHDRRIADQYERIIDTLQEDREMYRRQLIAEREGHDEPVPEPMPLPTETIDDIDFNEER